MLLLGCGANSPVKDSQSSSEGMKGYIESHQFAEHVLNASPAEEKSFGQDIYDEKALDPNQRFSQSAIEGRFITILRNLLPYVSAPRDEYRQESFYRVVLSGYPMLPGDPVNANSWPGGFLSFNSRLIKLMKNEAQLASIVAHEIGHIVERHSLQTIAREIRQQGNQKISPPLFKEIGSWFVDSFLDTHERREFEFEADNFAVNLLYASPYPAAEYIEAFKLISDERKLQGIPDHRSLFSSHPANWERIRNITRQAKSKETDGIGTNHLEFHLFKCEHLPKICSN